MIHNPSRETQLAITVKTKYYVPQYSKLKSSKFTCGHVLELRVIVVVIKIDQCVTQVQHRSNRRFL